MFSRRDFLKKASLAPAVPLSAMVDFDQDDPEAGKTDAGPRIAKFTIFPARGSFYRFIGPNSYDEKPKGIEGNPRRTLLVELSDGTVGMGTIGYRPLTDEVLKETKQLLGKDILSVYRWDGDRIADAAFGFEKFIYDASYSWVESAILDAVGKVKGMPVWQLFGDSLKNGVDPYDGTLYFAEIAQNRDVGLIGEIGKQIKRDGYGAIKLKVGRSDKWLPGEAGVERDIEAFITLREAVGTNFNLMTDANNGYRDRIEWALRFLKACAPYDMYFIEELIPDDTERYLEIREELRKENLHIPIADGESIWSPDMLDIFTEYCEAGVYSFIQPDMPTCGFTNILRTARMAERYPHVKLIPHVWQSEMGLYMSAHVAKIQSNIPFIEDSRYDEHCMIGTDYAFDRGQWFVPDLTGWGVNLTPGYEEYVMGDPIEIS